MDGVVRCLRDGSGTASTSSSASAPSKTNSTNTANSIAPLVVVQDSLDVVGGPAVLQRTLHDLCTAIAQGRAQATRAVAVALEHPPAVLHACVEPCLPDSVVLDCYSDPFGWCSGGTCGSSRGDGGSDSGGSRNNCSSAASGVSGAVHLCCTSDGPVSELHRRLEEMLSPPAHSEHQLQGQVRDTCVAIDSLSTLLEYACSGIGSGNGSGSGRAEDREDAEDGALALLEALQAHPRVSCVLVGLHADLHPPELGSALRQLTSCLVRLGPCTPLEAELAAADGAAPGGGRRPLGRLDARHRRRTGRIRVETELYAALAPGPRGVVTWPPPRPAVTPQMLAARALAQQAQQQKQGRQHEANTAAAAEAPTAGAGAAAGAAATAAGGTAGAAAAGAAAAGAAGAAGGTGVPALAQQFAGGMKLSLSEQEREDRARVVLPYEHRGGAGGMAAAAAATAGTGGPGSVPSSAGISGGGGGDWRDYLPQAAGGNAASLTHAPEARSGECGGGAAAAGGRRMGRAEMPEIGSGSSVVVGDRGAAVTVPAAPAAPAAAAPGLGTIHYVRDTDSEYDSDEDPDDDLDI